MENHKFLPKTIIYKKKFSVKILDFFSNALNLYFVELK